MILVLDACTISNLYNAFQDDSLIRLLPKCFSEIHVTNEVIKEIDDNKLKYLDFYESIDDLKQLISDIRLEDFLSKLDKDKHECIPFLRRFADRKSLKLKENDGEFHSALLSLYLSRWGEKDLYENNNRVLFATDDLRAEFFYRTLFSSNQIGIIIDSIDILTILYLKKFKTRQAVIKYVEALIGLYNSSFKSFRREVEAIKKTEKSPQLQLLLTNLIECISDGEIERLIDTINLPPYKPLYRKHTKLKDLIRALSFVEVDRKLKYIIDRHSEFKDKLIWTGID